MKRLLLLFFCILSIHNITNASHLVGGEMTYECLGNNQYSITLKVYRDCASVGTQGNLTPFDFNANISIFDAQTNLLQSSHQPPISSTTSITIPLPSNTMLTSPLCVDMATYQFTATLPPGEFIIAHQRCCRNSSISNLINPSNTGMTISTYIQNTNTCNNSPLYNQGPPIAFCFKDTIDYDAGAIDLNADSLAYSFCAPLFGATPNNPMPIIASNPPYAPVVFASPYTALAPIPAAPPLQIDVSTGHITGYPTTLGQFVFGVCVQEF